MACDFIAIDVKLSKAPKGIERLDELRSFFIAEYKISPKFFVKVPGRVNLIGEHVDYCGYPVLPMAIQQNILLAVSPSLDKTLHLRNVNSKYKAFECSIDSFKIHVPEKGGPEWQNYFLCGVKGIFDSFPEGFEKHGMMVAVSGNIPPASGLSSSSALVSSATLSTSFVNNLSLNKQLLSTISANCERYIGTQGGGMDQAIAFLAEEGCAQFIDWDPLTATPVSLPNQSVFVIANSLAEANKAANSDFNQRVVECRLGCSIIAKKSELDWREINKFATLQKILKCSLEKMESLADEYLPNDIYSVQDILNELGITTAELETKFLSANTKHIQEFKLRQRALHVFQESIRVCKFRKIATNDGSIEELGTLMRQSHFSLDNKYECSHIKLNKLVEISDNFGIGSRLTGAGWGGSIVALCDSTAKSIAYIEELKRLYYNELPNIENIDLRSVVFATSPQSGAVIFLEENTCE